MKTAENIEKLIKAFFKTKKSSAVMSLEKDKQILNDALTAYEKSKMNILAEYEPSVWRIIMKSRITKFAAAAIIVAAILSIHWLGGSKTGVVWADIIERVEQIKTCVLKSRTIMTGGPSGQKESVLDNTLYLSRDYGCRVDEYTNDNNLMQSTYIMPDKKRMITVFPAKKSYQEVVLTDEITANLKNLRQDPRDMIKYFMSGERKELGRDTINGVEVEGIEVVNPPALKDAYSNFIGRMWVSIKTQIPVKMETKVVGNGNSMTRTDSFDWSIELGPEVFEPNIPADYTMIEVPEISEINVPSQEEMNIDTK